MVTLLLKVSPLQQIAIPLAVAGLFLTMIVRTISVGLVHTADAAAKEGNIAAVERAHFIALLLQGLRIAIPAAFLSLSCFCRFKMLLN